MNINIINIAAISFITGFSAGCIITNIILKIKSKKQQNNKYKEEAEKYKFLLYQRSIED